MKKSIFLLLAILTPLFFSNVLALCSNSVDDFAFEVLLNNPKISYNLNMLDKMDNIIIKDNKYILQSSYSPSIAVILEKKDADLSIRWQIPVKAEEKTLPYLKFISSIPKKINLSSSSMNGWDVSCSQSQECEFKKSGITILASSIAQNTYEAVIEITKELSTSCKNCDGSCIIAKEERCIPSDLKEDIKSILKNSGMIGTFEELLSSYRVISFGKIKRTDLSPQTTSDINWEKAVKSDFIVLYYNGVVSIPNSEIEAISSLAKQGASGSNSKLVFEDNSWKYYYQTKFPVLTNLVNCQEFPVSYIPTGAVVLHSNQGISTYYLIPIIMVVSLVVLFVVLIFVARLLEISSRKRKLKPITGLHSNK